MLLHPAPMRRHVKRVSDTCNFDDGVRGEEWVKASGVMECGAGRV